MPIIVVDSEEEALERANDSKFGLGASVWTKDRAKGERMARRIESGMVWINDHSYTHAACQCSWGGVKDSGLGRSHSKFGFYECVNVKLVSWEPGLTRDFWWQPYDRTLGEAVRASARLLYGRNGQRLRGAARGRPAAAAGRRPHAAQGPLISAERSVDGVSAGDQSLLLGTCSAAPSAPRSCRCAAGLDATRAPVAVPNVPWKLAVSFFQIFHLPPPPGSGRRSECRSRCSSGTAHRTPKLRPAERAGLDDRARP